jgi:xylono-1,5-lactonase
MQCIWKLDAALGEGPLWDVAGNALWFVDIVAGRIHRCDGDGANQETFEVGGSPSFILPRAAGGFVVGNGGALQHFEHDSVQGVVAAIDGPKDTRLNDATTDTHGRLWFGSMDLHEKRPSGCVHVRVGGATHIAGGECAITNGPAITRDGRYLYHVDTLARTIWRFDIAGQNELSNGQLFVQIEENAGYPDGVTIDADDHLWVGLWSGWAARRYDPHGVLVDEIRFPCANVTKLAFGGPEMKTAFATTARKGLTTAELAEQPLAGGLFAFAARVPGVATTPAKL